MHTNVPSMTGDPPMVCSLRIFTFVARALARCQSAASAQAMDIANPPLLPAAPPFSLLS
jgi:hypothetical protein